MGMFTVLVGGNREPQASLFRRMPPPSFRPHAVIDDVCDLPKVLRGFPPASREADGSDGGARREAPLHQTGGKE
jgi:hypothetical protein